ncbi:MAG: transglycosylase SLT domain-containing protein [Acidobacteriota bacterium]
MKIFAVTAVLLLLLNANIHPQQSDAALRRAMEQDADGRDSSGKLQTLSAAEHLARAESYSANRLFPQAREHWQKILDNYPNDPSMPKVLLGVGRSYMWERNYAKAITWFDKLTRSFPEIKEGREGLAFTGACYVRLGKNHDAANAYEKYTVMFPAGERIETAYLNIIDALREAGHYDDAETWVDKARSRFPGKSTEVSALHARLRMEIYRGRWNDAITAADSLLILSAFGPSMTSQSEVKYLKAFALERAGQNQQAMSLFAAIPSDYSSYFGGLAALKGLSGSMVRIGSVSPTDYPAAYRDEILKNAQLRKVDPRFVLAIMKQESTFRPGIKSPAGARGLLQLVYDTALKYNKAAGYPNLRPDDLYTPAVNIAVGTEYLSELNTEFNGLYEAVAASYNGGEDNAARWLNRSKPKEAGIFTSEIGFAETKAYVAKVMNNYRVYKDLYDESLNRR